MDWVSASSSLRGELAIAPGPFIESVQLLEAPHNPYYFDDSQVVLKASPVT